MSTRPTHRLDPLLRPHSIAIVGASARADSMGEWALVNVQRGGFDGRIYPVNPGYRELGGLECFPDLAALPDTPDLVIFCIGDSRIEQALDDAISKGVPAAVLMSTLVLDDDAEPDLQHRVRAKVRDAGMLLCGANGMGFYNVRDGVWACGFDSRMHAPPGNISLISHSGSGMCGIIDCDERVRVNVAVSTGNELGVSMDQYLDFVLDLPETRVIGLFIETARNPQGFEAALAKAADSRVPVVALKVGRTEKSAELAKSHSGAIAGDDATYEALFARHGVHRVRDMDELATTLILFAELGPVGPGGLVTLHDSGGERQLMADLADAAGVPMTELRDATARDLEQVLDPELPAINPLDAWSRGGDGAGEQMTRSLSLMMQDPGTSLGAIIHARAPDGVIYESYVGYMERAHAESGKPVALVAARQGTGSDPLVVETTHRGFPVLDGVSPFLTGVRALFAHRDYVKPGDAPAAPEAAIVTWRDRLSAQPELDEAGSLAMLEDFGIAVCPHRIATTREQVLGAANELQFPLVMKTAMPGIAHKSDLQGVALKLCGEAQLIDAYDDFSTRLGPRVLLAEMAGAGVEMMLGARRDPQFGPIVVIGFGGTLAEVVADVTFALPPFDALYARRQIDRLRLRPLLDGVRGRAPVDVDGLCDMAARFSAMVDALRASLTEVDVNPVIVGPQTVVAVDALIVGRES